MKVRFLALPLGLFCMQLTAQNTERPKLIVGLVVDQMRYDYLTRFEADYGEDGFKRLMREGLNCKNVHYNYKPTYTGPGHATIFTGTSPSVHGIVGNNWFERAENKSVYCVTLKSGVDSAVSNPKRLLVETLSDAMKQFSNFDSKSYGISLKDRGAILPAGHLANGAYWFSSENGIWESDAYYENENPKWLSNFNQQDLAKRYLKQPWTLSQSWATYNESIPDSNAFEYPLSKNTTPVFPYDLMKIKEEIGWGVLKKIPQGNQMSADLFKSLVRNEGLGKGNSTDFISLSFSATDYVGHRFGVQSVEVQDTYIKLDQTIADLLIFLDQQVGKENYTLFLTSDHGAGMPRAYLKEKGIPTGELNSRRISKSLDSLLRANNLNDEWILKLMNLNVYFDDSLKSAKPQEYKIAKKLCQEYLVLHPGIAKVLDPFVSVNTTDQRSEMALRGFHPNRSGDLILIEEANWSTYTDKGSTHGSPYEYDTHVPLLFYGFKVPKGKTSVATYPVTSIVSSLSLLFGFQLNEVIQAEPIKELIE